MLRSSEEGLDRLSSLHFQVGELSSFNFALLGRGLRLAQTFFLQSSNFKSHRIEAQFPFRGLFLMWMRLLWEGKFCQLTGWASIASTLWLCFLFFSLQQFHRMFLVSDMCFCPLSCLILTLFQIAAIREFALQSSFFSSCKCRLRSRWIFSHANGAWWIIELEACLHLYSGLLFFPNISNLMTRSSVRVH